MALPSEQVLDELDQQEMHLRRLARRIDHFHDDAASEELAIATRLHLALQGALQPLPGDPNEMRQMMALWLRSDAQRKCTVQVAEAAVRVGAKVDIEDLKTNLNHGFERMPSTLMRHMTDNPADGFLMPASAHEKEQLDLALNVVQDELLRITLALDDLK